METSEDDDNDNAADETGSESPPASPPSSPIEIVRGLSSELTVGDGEPRLQLVVETNKPVASEPHRYQCEWFINRAQVADHEATVATYEQVLEHNKLSLNWLRAIRADRDHHALVECHIKELRRQRLGGRRHHHHHQHHQQTQTSAHLISVCRLNVVSTATPAKPPQQQQQEQEQEVFSKKLDDFVQIDSGMSLDLFARVNFHASEQGVRWYKDNVPIDASGNANMHPSANAGDMSYSLRIDNCAPSDSGVYSISVDGHACSSEVTIVESLVRFLQPLVERQYFDLAADTSYTLDCQLNKPAAYFGLRPVWLRNDVELRAGRKYDMVEEHNICALIIYDLEERDAAFYSCCVGESASTDCRLAHVHYLIKDLPAELVVHEEDACTLSFALNRAPDERLMPRVLTRWFKDGREINTSNTSEQQWTIEKGNERALSIHAARLSDSGRYSAAVVDESMQSASTLCTTSECRLIVNKPRVEFVTELERHVSGTLNDTLKLYCETVQHNLRPVWYFNDEPIVVADEQASQQHAHKECYSTHTQHLLIINEARASDAGLYRLCFPNGESYESVLTIHTPNTSGEFFNLYLRFSISKRFFFHHTTKQVPNKIPNEN